MKRQRVVTHNDNDNDVVTYTVADRPPIYSYDVAREVAMLFLCHYKQMGLPKDIARIIARYIYDDPSIKPGDRRRPIHNADAFFDDVATYLPEYDTIAWQSLDAFICICTVCMAPCRGNEYGCPIHGKHMGICQYCRSRGHTHLDRNGCCTRCQRYSHWFNRNPFLRPVRVLEGMVNQSRFSSGEVYGIPLFTPSPYMRQSRLENE